MVDVYGYLNLNNEGKTNLFSALDLVSRIDIGNKMPNSSLVRPKIKYIDVNDDLQKLRIIENKEEYLKEMFKFFKGRITVYGSSRDDLSIDKNKLEINLFEIAYRLSAFEMIENPFENNLAMLFLLSVYQPEKAKPKMGEVEQKLSYIGYEKLTIDRRVETLIKSLCRTNIPSNYKKIFGCGYDNFFKYYYP